MPSKYAVKALEIRKYFFMLYFYASFSSPRIVFVPFEGYLGLVGFKVNFFSLGASGQTLFLVLAREARNH